MQRKTLFGKFTLSTAALAALMFAGAPRLHADNCQTKIAKADHNLHEAIEDHGYKSQQADHARHELNEAREQCWTSDQRWWDEDQTRRGVVPRQRIVGAASDAAATRAWREKPSASRRSDHRQD